ncbi:hypothetical protein ABH926_009624 [Catenulispora sp. GP43]|uniref:hypothetical protein n=1 Tax=Catenulispora sp. GP43 TaxID=3156263 RepID=UPI00351820D6
MRDGVVGWGEETVPPQQDAVPSASESGPEPESFWKRWRAETAIAVLVIGFIAGAVVPVMLCLRGWHSAETIRGLGAGRGVFTVVSCGDQQKDDDDNSTYTCTGTFALQGASAVGDSAAPRMYKVTDDITHKAGATLLGRMNSDGDVSLPDGLGAAATMAFWLVVALETALAEGMVVRMLARWIRGVPQGLEWGDALIWVLAALFVGVMLHLLLLGIVAVCFAIW